jgi:hypothetical protein
MMGIDGMLEGLDLLMKGLFGAAVIGAVVAVGGIGTSIYYGVKSHNKTYVEQRDFNFDGRDDIKIDFKDGTKYLLSRPDGTYEAAKVITINKANYVKTDKDWFSIEKGGLLKKLNGAPGL